MSQRLGQVYFAPQRQSPFLNPFQGGGEYSEETARKIDEEVRRIIDEQYGAAVSILRANLELLHQTARRLLKDEIIEGQELAELQRQVILPGADRPQAAEAEPDQPLAA